MQIRFSGRKVRKLRKARNLSQEELAEMSNTSERYIRDLERGEKVNPSVTVACSISRALELASMEELMDVVDDESNM